MRILITGITGFVGGHLVERLVARARAVRVCRADRLAGEPGPSGAQGRTALPGELSDGPRVEAMLGTRGRTGSSTSRATPTPAARSGTRPLLDRQPRRDAIALRRHRPHRPAAAHPLRLHRPDLRRTGRARRSVRRADHSEAGQPLRRQQGRRRPSQLPVHAQPRSRHRPRAAVQPDRPAAKSPDYAVANFARQIAAIEAGRAAAGHRDRRPLRPPRHHRRARHGRRLPAAAGKGPTGRGVQRRPRRDLTAFRTCSTG